MLFAGHVIPLIEASEVNGVIFMTGSQPMPATTMPPFAGAVLEENIGGNVPQTEALIGERRKREKPSGVGYGEGVVPSPAE